MKAVSSAKNTVLFFLILFMAAALGFAENPEQKRERKIKEEEESLVRPHEEVIVTATMTRKAVKEVSASVSVIRSQDIEAVPASNALNLLTFSPGVFISKTGDFGRADVNIRGLGERGRKIAILTDGRPEKMSLFGCLVTHTFSLDNVERIEVVRGPSSVFYGSEALGGVINIMTHMPVKGFETDLAAFYGGFNTRQFTLKHGGVIGRLSYFLTADRRMSDGHRENSDYEGTSFTGKALYRISGRFSASFQGKFYTGRKSEAGPVGTPLIDFWNDYERGALDLSVKGRWEKDEIFFKLYRNFGHHRFSDGWHSRDGIYGGIIRYTSRRIPGNELTVGGDFRFLQGRSHNFPAGEWSKSEAALFVHDHYVLYRRWILSGGLRLHRDSLYGLEITPQIGIVYQAAEKISFKGSVSKGFRSPQINELFMFPPANPELEPERLWSYEIGYEQGFGDWLSLGLTFFLMEGSNLVELQSNTSPPPLFLFQNSGAYTFRGAEVSLQADFFSGLSGQVFYSYLDRGENTRGRQGHKLDFSLRFASKSFFASLNAQFVADYFAADHFSMPLPDYFVLGSRFRLDVTSAVELIVDVNNVFDKDYLIFVELPGIASGSYPMPGRNVQVGIRFKK